MFSIHRSVFIGLSQQLRFSLSAVESAKNHYDTLGLTSKATQNDVKSAYYKLSMVYHPDKNKGSENALQKFRDIAAAYEVLGNFRLRKLYDKGLLHTAGPQFAAQTDAVREEDDAQTKFYKARMKRSHAPAPSGRTPIYNFDEWSQAHYGAAFQRRSANKQKYEQKIARDQDIMFDKQFERLMFGICSVIFAFLGITTYLGTNDVDQLAETNKKSKSEMSPSLEN